MWFGIRMAASTSPTCLIRNPERQKRHNREKKEQVKPAKTEPAAPAKPLSADDIPVAIAIGKIWHGKGNRQLHRDENRPADHDLQSYHSGSLHHDRSQGFTNKDSVRLKVTAGDQDRRPRKIRIGGIIRYRPEYDRNGRILFGQEDPPARSEARHHACSPHGSITAADIQ